MAVRRVWGAIALIAFVALVASSGPTRAQAQGTDDLDALNRQVAQLYQAGKYAEATEIAKLQLAVAERKFRADHPSVAIALNNLALLYQAQGRYAEAEPLYKRTLTTIEKALGADHHNVATPLNNLAELYRAQGRYGEAEPLYKRSLAIREKALGPDHPDVGQSLNNLALLYDAQGRYPEAEPLYKRTLTIFEKALSPEHATALNNLALLYQAQGRYAEAEPLFKRALAAREKSLGPEHPDVGQPLNNLAELYRAQGRYGEAELLYNRALAIFEKALGPEHPSVAIALNNLALLYKAQGRYAEAEPLYKRTLTIIEKALGPDHSLVATALNNLAELGRYAEAEPLYKRALAIREKALGPEHPDVAQSLNNLALLYYRQGRYPEAEPLYKRSLAITEKAHGPDHPDVATALNNLAALAVVQRDWEHAADFWQRATSIIERRAEHGLTGFEGGSVEGEAVRNSWYFSGLVKMTDRLSVQGHGDSAKRGREMFEKAQWAQASEAASSLAQMAARSARGDTALARLVRERQDLVTEWRVKDKQLVAAKSHPPVKRNLDAEKSLSDRLAIIDTRLEAIDAQFAKDFPDYAALSNPRPISVAEVQAKLRDGEALVLFLDTADDWAPVVPEETFIWVVTKGDMRWVKSELGTKALIEHVAAVRCGLDTVPWDDEKAAERCRTLLKAEPERDGHGNVRAETLPFDLARSHVLYKALFGQVEDLIRDKSLLIVLSGPLTQLPFQTLVVSAPDGNTSGWRTREVGRLGVELGPLPNDVRQHLNGQGVAVIRPLAGAPAEAVGIKAGDVLLTIDGVAVGSVEQAISAIRAHPPGIALPLQLSREGAEIRLVAELDASTEQEWVPHILKASERAVDWLARGHALTVLPAVSSLKALRQLAKENHASRALIGFGNPLLNGPDARYATLAAAARSKMSCPGLLKQRVAALTGKRRGVLPLTFRSGLADGGEIRSQVPLPETADELCSVARDLGVSEKDVWLGNRATEAKIKRLSEAGELAKYRIIHFATHGALAGQVDGNSEPGLILTPPTTATERDDGYLSASEIAQLKLDADWVILSACNTAAGNAEGAEALSGLARAFFYAGARALLVSHWAVASDATVKLITGAVGRMASDKSIGRAEAMRQSMLAMIDEGQPVETHPAFWAPFIVVGEGGGEATALTTSSVVSGHVAQPVAKTVGKPNAPPTKKLAPSDWKMKIWPQ
jgi:CHAT domain-containing protein/tetratricopeptide (TPR) repeat protein